MKRRITIMHPWFGEVSVYPVGVLDHWQRGRLRQQLEHFRRHLRARNWRAIKSSFNGYLAEPADWPSGLRRCGSGWSHERALASLEHYARRDGVVT